MPRRAPPSRARRATPNMPRSPREDGVNKPSSVAQHYTRQPTRGPRGVTPPKVAPQMQRGGRGGSAMSAQRPQVGQAMSAQRPQVGQVGQASQVGRAMPAQRPQVGQVGSATPQTQQAQQKAHPNPDRLDRQTAFNQMAQAGAMGPAQNAGMGKPTPPMGMGGMGKPTPPMGMPPSPMGGMAKPMGMPPSPMGGMAKPMGMKKGGKVGGRGDGAATKGKTKGRMC
jgi:hypothetical protein